MGLGTWLKHRNGKKLKRAATTVGRAAGRYSAVAYKEAIKQAKREAKLQIAAHEIRVKKRAKLVPEYQLRRRYGYVLRKKTRKRPKKRRVATKRAVPRQITAPRQTELWKMGGAGW